MSVGSILIGEASGIRNIRLACLALGMPKRARRRLDELVDFTELGDAIHRPLNTFVGHAGKSAVRHSNGSDATDPSTDEALGVGDKTSGLSHVKHRRNH